MLDSNDPAYGERAVSWLTVWNDLFRESQLDPHDDYSAAEMHRLRGLVAAQAAETEEVLGRVAQCLDPAYDPERRTGGQILRDVERLLADRVDHADLLLGEIRDGIRRRNHAVHNTVEIGSVWRDYASGDGEWVPVVSTMGRDEYDESDLRNDLACQHRATVAAVRLLGSLGWNGDRSDD